MAGQQLKDSKVLRFMQFLSSFRFSSVPAILAALTALSVKLQGYAVLGFPAGPVDAS